MKISGKYFKLSIFIITLFLSSSLISQGLPARISNISGEVIIKRAVYTESEYAAINLPVEPGDSFYVKSGYVNIDVEDGSVVRINDNSFCKFLLIGNSGDNDEIATRLYAYSGSYELFPAPDIKNEKSYIDLETNTGIVTAFPDAVIKVKVNEDGSVIIDVISGSGAYKTPLEEKMIYAGDIVEINPSGVGSIAHRENPTSSSTSRYQNSTDDEYSSPSRAYIPKKLYSSSRTLDENGTWVYVSSYGYCWKPRTVIVEWKPYSYGQWIWTSRWGYIWVSSEPWCWTTYHYGYWVWSKYHGWIWMPGSTWCSSRVVWAWGIGWIGWFPYPPYYSWWHWYPYNWWCCATWGSFYTPRYRYHSPRYGYVGDKPVYGYERTRPSERIEPRPEERPDAPIYAVEPEITELDPGLTDASRISETDINERSEIQPVRRPITDVSTEDNMRRIEEVSNTRTNPGNQNTRNPQENDYVPTIIAPRPNDRNTETTSRPVYTRPVENNSQNETPETRTTPPQNTRPTNQTDRDNNTRTNPPTTNDTNNNTRTNPPTTNDTNNNTRTNPPTNNNQNNNRTNPPTTNNQNNTRTNPPTTNDTNNNTRTNPPQRQNPPQRNNPPVNNNNNEEEDRDNSNTRPSRERR